MSKVVGRYVEATTRASLRKGSRFRAMDEFLMSDQMADAPREAAHLIANAAADLAMVEASDSGSYAGSFRVHETAPIWAGVPRFPRRTFMVVNDDEAAAAVEFGNVQVDADGDPIVREPLRILGRAGEPFHIERTVRGVE